MSGPLADPALGPDAGLQKPAPRALGGALKGALGGAGESRAAIVRLLSVLRDAKEVRQYLQRFSSLEQTRFAVIKVGGAVLRDARETLADALAFLQTVGLTPVVVHGGGPQLDAALAAAGVPTEKRDGLRVTTPQALAVARQVFMAENIALVEAVRAAGGRAAAIPTGVFEAVPFQHGAYGLVGEPERARLDLVESAARAGAVPVLASLGLTAHGQLLNINADAAVAALVRALEPYKIVFLTETGGVLDGDGRVLSAINLATDRDALMAAPWLQGGMRLKLTEIAKLLNDLPLTSSVSITTAQGLAQELFTHGGAGTMVRRGERIDVVTDKRALDRAAVEALVAGAFGRPAAPDWWERLELTTAYVTQRRRAGAFLTRLGDVAYLDKFAVLESARGEGLGQAVWARAAADHPRLVWRARSDNPVNEFYFKVCDGAVKRAPWIVYWRGLDAGEAAPLAEQAAARPPTLMEATMSSEDAAS